MTKTRVFTLILSVTAVAGLGAGFAQAGDVKPCVATTFKIAKVKAACESGGQAAAKKLMKTATDKAKAAGEDMNCKTCHSDLKTYAITGADTVAKIQKWL